MSNSKELKTVTICREDLRITIRNNLDRVAQFMQVEDIITRETWREATDTKSSADNRAKELLIKWEDRVEEDPSFYTKVVEGHFRQNPEHYKSILSKLDKENRRQGGSPACRQQKLDEPVAKVHQSSSTTASSAAVAPNPNSGSKVFSTELSAEELADWFHSHHKLPESACKILKDESISGSVFVDLKKEDIDSLGFNFGASKILLKVLNQMKGEQPAQDSVSAPKPAEPSPSGQEDDNDDDSVVASDGRKVKYSLHHLAMDRGTYVPQLKFEASPDVIAELKPKQEVKVPYYERGYYAMNSDRHGVCLIINNKTFKGKTERTGTDRDEENLVETWRYLGYHVEVRRDMNFQKTINIFGNIDDFLSGVDKKTDEKSKLAHDSFVCCLLSHGNKSCIFSCDSKEIPIEYFETSLGDSKKLGRKPKIFFIQACQGENFGSRIVEIPHEENSLKPDGDIETTNRADIYKSCATVPGNQAYRHEEKGSWYISAVCKTLCEESKQNTLDQLQKFINERVAEDKEKVYVSRMMNKYKQQPAGSDQLSKNVHFFYYEETGIVAT